MRTYPTRARKLPHYLSFFGLLLLLPAFLLAKTIQHLPSNAVVPSTKPVIIANYFVHESTPGRILGTPLTFQTNNAPNLTKADLKVQLSQANPGIIGQRDSLTFQVTWRLTIQNNAFKTIPTAYMEIVGISSTSAVRKIFVRDIYPQDFQTINTPTDFTMRLADYNLASNEKLQVTIRQGSGTSTVSLVSLSIFPTEYVPFWDNWTNVPFSGGIEPGYGYRLFDPDRLLAGTWNAAYGGGNSTLTQTIIEPWRRDIAVGHKGDYPYIGPYKQRDPDLLRYHIQQAKAAGIDAFKIYMYFPDGYANGQCVDWSARYNADYKYKAVERMFAIAEEEHFKLMFNDSTLSGASPINPSNTYTYDDALCNLQFLAQKGFFNHTAYLRIDGRPAYDLPVLSERNATSIQNFVSRINAAYRASGGTTNLYTFITASTLYGPDEKTGVNLYGPYNMHMNIFWFSNMSRLTIDPNESQYSLGNELRNWTRYASCAVPPQTYLDILNPSKCSCKFAAGKPVDGYCFHKATLLARENLAPFRNLPGIDSLYDWTSSATYIAPRYLTVDTTGKPFMAGTSDTITAGQMMREYVQDAHLNGYDATLTIAPGYDNSNWRGGTFALADRRESDGSGVLFKRLITEALAARPETIMIENWNGWPEGKQIEPSVDYKDITGASKPNLYLSLIAEALGGMYSPPCIPASIVDPLRLLSIPLRERCSTTPTPTPVKPSNTPPMPSSTPVPSATPPVATNAQLSLELFLHGIGKGGDNVNASVSGNMNPTQKERRVFIELFDQNNQRIKIIDGIITFQSETGNFTGLVVLQQVPTGVYTLIIRIPQYLTKSVPGIIAITAGQTTSVKNLYFTTGDANGDNRLNVLDYNFLADCFSDLTPPKNCSDTNKKRMTDFTDDGNVNQFDYNLFLREISVQTGQ